MLVPPKNYFTFISCEQCNCIKGSEKKQLRKLLFLFFTKPVTSFKFQWFYRMLFRDAFPCFCKAFSGASYDRAVKKGECFMRSRFFTFHSVLFLVFSAKSATRHLHLLVLICRIVLDILYSFAMKYSSASCPSKSPVLICSST